MCLFRYEPKGIEKSEYELWIYETFINFSTFNLGIPPNLSEDISKKLRKNVYLQVNLGTINIR